MGNYVDSRIQDIVLDTILDVPPGLNRVTCMVCRMEFAGLVYNKNTEAGPIAENKLNNLLCETCRLLREDIALRKGLVT